MSSLSINKSSFVLEPVKGGYQLNVLFFEKDHLVSTRKFTFSCPQKEESKVAKEENGKGGELLDIYSQNGVCSLDIASTLFKKSDEQGVKKSCALIKTHGLKGEKVIVLDLKDPETGYRVNREATIVKCEKAVCEFFKSKLGKDGVSKHARKVHESSPDFVLCEGSLKMDILKCGGFSREEEEYFHTSDGAKSFCQCAEFFMNAFKFGEAAVGEQGSLTAEHYIVSVSTKSFTPFAKSTVLYPAPYKDIYSLQGEFAKLLGTVFKISGSYDAPSKITTMSVVKP